MILGAEEELSELTGWRMKVVEASGKPIAQALKPKFEMEEGCVLGHLCVLCDNSGDSCGVKMLFIVQSAHSAPHL